MTTNELMADGFDRLKPVVHTALKDAAADELAYRPYDKGNSISWLVWHLSRVQDDHIAELADREQVWLSGGWHDEFGLPFEKQATGYGQDSDQVSQVQVDGELLKGYFDAVQQATSDFLTGLKPEDYDRIIDESWDPPVTLGVRLVSVLVDDWQHAGQAAYVRGLL
ncbi:MAG TPA: DUF664 domain-containing protein [Candidatus Saccharimonadales bacterium]|jgi:hypothetical protein|nr:DUF664 domain-containing protein [Candidatus Saccharimonadales bacterium]